MVAVIIFFLIFLLIIGLIYGVVKLNQKTKKSMPLIIGLYIIIGIITLFWCYYGFLFLTIIMRGV